MTRTRNDADPEKVIRRAHKLIDEAFGPMPEVGLLWRVKWLIEGEKRAARLEAANKRREESLRR